jgi:hypothetical protein
MRPPACIPAQTYLGNPDSARNPEQIDALDEILDLIENKRPILAPGVQHHLSAAKIHIAESRDWLLGIEHRRQRAGIVD